MTNKSIDACYRDLMWSSIDSSTTTRSIEMYDFKFFRPEIWPRLLYLFRVSFLTTLNIYKAYKAYFKSRQHEDRDQETYFLNEKLLCLYTIGFCNQVLFDLHYWWSEELCNQQHLFKLLELVTYWDPCKGLVIDWRFVHQGKEGYYKIKSNWVL